MAGERVKIVVRERESRGSADARRLRKQGLIPGVLYGRGEPKAFTVGERDLRAALTGDAGLHAILDVQIDGTGASHASVVKDYQQDVVRGGITHIDLHEVRLDQPIHSTVALHLVGEAAGSKEGGVLSQSLNELNVEALPLEIPPAIEVDVSELHIGDSLRIADVTAPEGVTLLDDPETPIASVTLPTRVEEPEETLEEGEEVPEGAVPSSAEEAPEGGSEAPLEPDADAAGEHQPVEG
jgi:large subunit ribosomal protein L25